MLTYEQKIRLWEILSPYRGNPAARTMLMEALGTVSRPMNSDKTVTVADGDTSK